jgi:Mg-chelatase subunit ChlD
LILLTDGRANVALRSGDPWREAIEIAGELRCAALVVDTENTAQPLHRPVELAEALGAEYITLRDLEDSGKVAITPQRSSAPQ